MSAAEVIAEIESLPEPDRVKVAEETLRRLTPEDLKIIGRMLRRLAHPDIPEEVWNGFEDYEDGRFVDMETALHETPPSHILERRQRL